MRFKLAEVIAIGSFLLAFANIMKFKKKHVTWIFGAVCVVATIVAFSSKEQNNSGTPNSVSTQGDSSPVVNQTASASGGSTLNQAGRDQINTAGATINQGGDMTQLFQAA